MNNQVLLECYQKARSPRSAYNELYTPKRLPLRRRAHFIKLKIRIPDEPGVSRFLAILFCLPMPIFMVRVILSFVKLDQTNNQLPIEKKEIMELLRFRGVQVQVRSHDGVRVLIKTI